MAKGGRGVPSRKVGVVVSDKMDKTVVVQVERTVRHPRYEQYVRLRSKFMAHDARNECRVGDVVEIVESRPLSARKRWRVRRVLRTAAGTRFEGAPAAEIEV